MSLASHACELSVERDAVTRVVMTRDHNHGVIFNALTEDLFASSAGEPFEPSVQPFARGRARWLHVPLAVGDLI